MDATNSTKATWIVGSALVLAALIGAVSFYEAKRPVDTLSVTGSAERVITADVAKWTSNVSRNADSASLKTASEQITKDTAAVRAYFRQAGIKDEEMTVNPVTVSPVCENQSNVVYDKFGNQTCGSGRPFGYSLQQTIVIDSNDAKKVTDLSQKAPGALIAKDIIFSSQNLEYYYSKLSDLRVELTGEATKDAEQRAQKIADATKSRIGALQSASLGVVQVTSKNSTEVSDYGAYDTTALEKKVTVVVKTSFVLKK